jgi:pimeloyl-ACP methyl ester carboxylesterase
MSRILYLHGFASGPSSSKARFFADRFRASGTAIEIPDLTAGDFEHLTITSQLAVIERAAAGEAVSLMGSSMGGYLAALYAARHPEVPRVVLLAPAFCFAQRWPELLGRDKFDEWQRTGQLEVFHYARGGPARLSFALMEDAVQYPAYPEFRQPALIFHGANDDQVPVRYSQEFAGVHPNVHLEVLASGHELLDVLDFLAPKVTAFLLG